jgi:hypothetical protein
MAGAAAQCRIPAWSRARRSRSSASRESPSTANAPSAALGRYPVVGELGWQLVTKCRSCLYSVEREPWGAHGPYTFLVDSLP